MTSLSEGGTWFSVPPGASPAQQKQASCSLSYCIALFPQPPELHTRWTLYKIPGLRQRWACCFQKIEVVNELNRFQAPSAGTGRGTPFLQESQEAGTVGENPKGTNQCLLALDCRDLLKHQLQMYEAVLWMELLPSLNVNKSISV